MNRKSLHFSAALLALALIPAALWAQPPGRGPGGRGFAHGPGGGFGPGMMGERMAERLGLSEDQQEAIGAIRDRYQGDLETQHQAASELRRSLAEQTHTEVLDEGAIRATAAELGTASGELAVTRARMAQEVRQILTEEQLAQLDEMRARFGERGRRGRFGGPPRQAGE